MLPLLPERVVSLSIFLLLITVTIGWSAPHDWGTNGVADTGDTAKVLNVLQLTDNSYNDSASDLFWPYYVPDPWSYSSDWVVYTASDSSGSKEIYKIRPDGTGLTRLTNNAVSDSNASFGADGRIYFQRNSGSPAFHILRMNSDGTNPLDLTALHSSASACGETCVKVSPDGNMIGYFDCGNRDLWVAQSNGSYPVQVSGVTTVDTPQHSWGPDSQYLLYSGADAFGTWIYKTNRDGTSNINLTKPDFLLGSINDGWPVWSPDGKKIAYVRETDFGLNRYYRLEIMDADGSYTKNLDNVSTETTGWQVIRGPLSWSPDSKWIVYLKRYVDTVNFGALFAVNVDDETIPPYQLTTGYYDFHPSWSPDGRKILFQDYSDYTSYGGTRDGAWSGDILLLNLERDFFGRFPWALFLPAIIDPGELGSI